MTAGHSPGRKGRHNPRGLKGLRLIGLSWVVRSTLHSARYRKRKNLRLNLMPKLDRFVNADKSLTMNR